MTPTTAISNPYKAAGQAKKALKLTCLLLKHGITINLAREMDQGQWNTVATAAGFEWASWETQGMVMQQLQEAVR